MQNTYKTNELNTIDYIASMAKDLKSMAITTRSNMLVYLLDLVIAEANAIQDNEGKTAKFMNSKF